MRLAGIHIFVAEVDVLLRIKLDMPELQYLACSQVGAARSASDREHALLETNFAHIQVALSRPRHIIVVYASSY